MECLLCRLAPITQDEPAGLCPSCRYAVKCGEYLVCASGETIVLSQALVSETLAPVAGSRFASWPYEPADLYPDGATPEQLAELRQQLHEITRPPIDNDNAAKRLLWEIRSHGIRVTLNHVEGRAVLDYPARCPYPLLIEFVRLQGFVEDVLTRELSKRYARQRAAEFVHMNKTAQLPLPEILSVIS